MGGISGGETLSKCSSKHVIVFKFVYISSVFYQSLLEVSFSSIIVAPIKLILFVTLLFTADNGFVKLFLCVIKIAKWNIKSWTTN